MTATPGTVFELIEQAAEARPDAVYAFAVDDAQEMSFAALRQSAMHLRESLASQGFAPGDTISVVMPNGLQTLRLLLGAMYAGCCVNPVNLLAQPEQMRYVLDHSDCRLVLASPEWAERVRVALARVEREVRVIVLAADGDSEDLRAALAFAGTSAARVPSPPPDREATALLMYTSGTTGVPKGVMLSQASLAANALAIGREHELGAADRVLAVLPLYHINAFAVTMLAPLAHGGSLALASRFSAAQFWAQAIGLRCTWLNVVPTIISYLLEGEAPPRASLAHIRFCRSASAALPREHHLAFEAKFGIGIVETMGLTETVAPSFSNPLAAAERKVGSVGRPSGGEARVVDAALAPLSDGSTGEIVIRGPHVMRGYYKNEEATRASFTPDGWLRTGDLGHRDRDGFFFVTGRIKELIIKGGENIAPREIDEALLAHPAVLDAAAVGIPDRHYGQEIMVCVVLREGAACDEAALRDFCVERLGRFKTPKVIRFVRELPRGPSGKVQRLKLLDAGI
jgi:acyl-CoA synthetase (AMP-forming)/AMP-acid ligase II